MNTTERSEWLDIRKKCIGGSEIGAILGLNKYMTAWDVWDRKVNGTEQPETQAMKSGRYLEEAIRKMCYDQLKVHEFPYHSHIRHMFYPIGVSLDGLGVLNDELTVFEFKNTRSYLKGEPLDSWVMQANWGAMVYERVYLTKINQICVYWLEQGFNPCYKILDVNRELQEIMFESACDFWRDYVETGIEPPIQSAATMIDKQGEAVEVHKDVAKMIVRMHEIKPQLDELEAEYEALKDDIKQLNLKNTTLTIDGTPVLKITETKGRASFDTKAFAAKYPNIHNEYTKQGKPSLTIKLI